MIDWEVNMIEPRHYDWIIVDELTEANDAMIASVTISAAESKMIDDNIVHLDPTFDDCMIANNTYDNVHVVLWSISAIHDPVQLYTKLLERRNVGTFAATIGSTTVGSNSPYVWEEDDTISTNDSSNDDATNDDLIDDFDIDNFKIDLDEMVSMMVSTISSKPTGVTAEHLSKIWRIDTKTVEKTLDITTQLLHRYQDPTLLRN